MKNYVLTDSFFEVETSVDDAHEIGSGPAYESRDAMRIGRTSDTNSELVYLGETQLDYKSRLRLIEDGAGKRWRWIRWEFQVSTRQTEVVRGNDLVISEYPYSIGWVLASPFKPWTKLTAEEQTEELSKQRFSSLEDCLDWVEDRRYDYWEKDKLLTAAISIPTDAAPPSERLRNTSKPPVYGICTNFKTCEQELLDSVEVQKLLSMAKANTLKFAYSTRKNQKLHPAAQEAAPALMVLSIRQALAGPHNNSEKWIGKPVTKYIAAIFCEHLDNKNRPLTGESELALGEEAIDYYTYRD